MGFFPLFFSLLLWCFTSTETTRLDRDEFIFFITVVVVLYFGIEPCLHVLSDNCCVQVAMLLMQPSAPYCAWGLQMLSPWASVAASS